MMNPKLTQDNFHLFTSREIGTLPENLDTYLNFKYPLGRYSPM